MTAKVHLVDRFKKHWSVALIALGATVFAYVVFVSQTFLLEPLKRKESDLQGEIDGYKGHITELEGEITKLEGEIREYKVRIEKPKEVVAKKKEPAPPAVPETENAEPQLRKANQALERKLEDRAEDVAQLEETLDKKTNLVDRLEVVLGEKEVEIRTGAEIQTRLSGLLEERSREVDKWKNRAQNCRSENHSPSRIDVVIVWDSTSLGAAKKAQANLEEAGYTVELIEDDTWETNAATRALARGVDPDNRVFPAKAIISKETLLEAAVEIQSRLRAIPALGDGNIPVTKENHTLWPLVNVGEDEVLIIMLNI